MKKTLLFRKFKNRILTCLACSWYCQIAPEKVGLCATRLNKNGTLYSLVYGKAIGLHLDPVEKKPLHHFLPGARLLSFGTLGCNFGCLFCQNWEMSQINKIKAAETSPKDLEKDLKEIIDQMSRKISPREIVELALKEKAQGIAYTYNEPAIFAEFTYETARLAKRKGLKNVYVSNGFLSRETFALMKNYLDGINIDLKSFRKEFYQKICRGKIESVKENIKKFFQAGIETEVTTLIIPGHNDSREEIKEIADFLFSISPEIPWHLSSFYPAYKMSNLPPTPYQTLLTAYQIGKEKGLKYIYLGNVSDSLHSSTYCPTCGSLLIKREGFFSQIKDLTKEGCCRKCGEKIYGLWC